MHLYYFFYAVFAMFLLAGSASEAEARSHFLPEYQGSTISFSADEKPVTNCPSSYITEDECKIQGKVPGGETCKDGSGVHYSSCLCPENYVAVTDGHFCAVKSCNQDNVDYCPADQLKCENTFQKCGNGMKGGGSSCIDGQGQEYYQKCLCDTSRFPKTNTICKKEIGENAVVSGETCEDGDGIYASGCSCTPNDLPDGYSSSCGSQGYSETIDNGCGETYYLCNAVCTPTCVDADGCEAYGTPIDNGCGGTCKVCQDIVDTCPSDKPYKNSSGQCVQCTQDIHCSGNMTCQNNSCQCPSDKPKKNSSGQCVQCTSDIHCGDNEKCNTSSGSCEAAQEYCVTGSIYYSDGTCSTAYNSEKTPLGVVVNPEFHLIVGLKNLTGPIVHGTNGFKNVGNEPVDNYSERGYENTQKIYELIKDTDRTTIISFCWEATSNALAGGRMYVPATAEASLIAKNITKINNTLEMLSQYRTDTLPVPGRIWTSDEAELGAPYTMLAYDIEADTALDGIPKYDPQMYGRCVGRYETDPFWGDTIKPSVDGMGNSYMTYPLTDNCRGSYFRDIFYWNPEYNRCVYDYELEAGGGEEPGPSLPSCEEWEENGWLDASTSYNSSVCRSYNESVQECQYKDGSKGKFCDLSTNCTFGAEAYRTYKYCPNGARCMYNSCQYYQNMSASESPRRLGRNKNCYACIQSTNESCGTRQNFVQCK